MTPEENRRRAEDEHVRYIKNHLCDKKSGRPYVFISYKSDDWETVLHDVVYRLMKEHGLNVYFDGSFDLHNDLWISQFPENMEHYNCKGVLAFIDDKYATSYATLLELMYSQTLTANKKVVQINLDRLTSFDGAAGEIDTGLGVTVYEDGITNVYAKKEKELFDKTFGQLVDRKVLKEAQYWYEPEKSLTKKKCSKVVTEMLGYLEINENPYTGPNGNLEGIVGSIRDACGKSVFHEEIRPAKPENVAVGLKDREDVQKVKIESGKISLKDFLKRYDNNSFKKDTYSKFKLVGTNGCEKYSTEYADSAFDLSWGFVMQVLADRGMAFIQEVAERHPDLKNPVFISQEEYDGRGEGQKKYKQIEIQGLEKYYMYRHWGQYQWIDSALKARLLDLGLTIDKFYFEYISEKDGGESEASPDKTDGSGETDGKEKAKKPVKMLSGSYKLEAFLAELDNQTFQSKSCNSLKLIGIDGCEKYTLEKQENGESFKTARQLVFGFAMARIDEMGMQYIDTVNASLNTKNPIFITQEEHLARKEKKESVTYTAVTSRAVEGYSMCTHYSEYDWIRNSLVKQLKALNLPLGNFRLEFE